MTNIIWMCRKHIFGHQGIIVSCLCLTIIEYAMKLQTWYCLITAGWLTFIFSVLPLLWLLVFGSDRRTWPTCSVSTTVTWPRLMAPPVEEQNASIYLQQGGTRSKTTACDNILLVQHMQEGNTFEHKYWRIYFQLWMIYLFIPFPRHTWCLCLWSIHSLPWL